jgi:hypothetical protein
MKVMKYLQLGVMVAAVAVAMGQISTARADSTAPYTTSISDTTTEWAGNLNFPQFDPSLGTLTEIELSLTGDLTTTITVTNDADSDSSGTVFTESVMTVTDSPNGYLDGSLHVDSSTASYTLGAGDSTVIGPLTGTQTDNLTSTAAGALAEYTGLGTVSLGVGTATQTYTGNTGGNTGSSQATQAGITGTITYVYDTDVVPSPAVIPGVLGLLGVIALGRKVRLA